MGLTAYERETVITLNDEDATVHIWTAQRPVVDRLKKNDNYTMTESGNHEGTEWAAFTIPKAKFRFTEKRTYNLTDEQRKAVGERLRNGRS